MHKTAVQPTAKLNCTIILQSIDTTTGDLACDVDAAMQAIVHALLRMPAARIVHFQREQATQLSNTQHVA